MLPEVIRNLKQYCRVSSSHLFFPRHLATVSESDASSPLEIFIASLAYEQTKWFFPGLRTFYNAPETMAWKILYQNGLLSGENAQANFDNVESHSNPKSLLKCLVIMGRSGLLRGGRGQANLDKLISIDNAFTRVEHLSDNSEDSIPMRVDQFYDRTEVERTLRRLNRTQLLQKNMMQINFDTCLDSISPEWTARSLKYLYKGGILTDQNRSFLASVKQSSAEMSGLLKIIYHQNLLTQENFDAIKNHPDHYTWHAELPPECIEPGKIYAYKTGDVIQVTLLSSNGNRVDGIINMDDFELNQHFFWDWMQSKEKFLQFVNHQLIEEDMLRKADNEKLGVLQYLSEKYPIGSTLANLVLAIEYLAGENALMGPEPSLLNASTELDLFNFIVRSAFQGPSCGVSPIVGIAHDIRALKHQNILTRENLSRLARLNKSAHLTIILRNFENVGLMNHPAFDFYLQVILRSPWGVGYGINIVSKVGLLQSPKAHQYVNAIEKAKQPFALGKALVALSQNGLLAEEQGQENFNQLLAHQDVLFDFGNINQDINEPDAGIFEEIPAKGFTQDRFNTLLRLAASKPDDFEALRCSLDIPKYNERQRLTEANLQALVLPKRYRGKPTMRLVLLKDYMRKILSDIQNELNGPNQAVATDNTQSLHEGSMQASSTESQVQGNDFYEELDIHEPHDVPLLQGLRYGRERAFFKENNVLQKEKMLTNSQSEVKGGVQTTERSLNN